MKKNDITECLLTDVKARPDHDVAELYFRNTGKLLIPLTNHLFTSRHFSNERTLDEVVADVASLPQAAVTHKKKDKRQRQPFNVIQVRGPPSLGKTLRERHGTHFDTKNYTRTARETFGNPGMVRAIDTEVAIAIKIAKAHNEKLREIKKHIRFHASDKSKGYATRVFNELTKAAHHEEPTLTLARQSSYLKKLPEHLIKERDKLQELYTLLKGTNGLQPRLKDGEIELLLEQEHQLGAFRTIDHLELINHTWAHLDIEIPGWNTSKPEISWVVIHYEHQGEVYKREMHTASSIGTDSFDNHDIQCYNGDIASLLLGVKESIRREDPLVMTAHNGKFDYIKLRDAEELAGLEESFTPDEENVARPVHEASTRFFERIGVKSRLLIDFLRFAQIQYDWLPNKKLNLVAKMMLGEGAFDKELTYDEMEQLEITARMYDRIKHKDNIHEVLAAQGRTIRDVQEQSQAAAIKIASYAGKDVDILAKMRSSPIFTHFLSRITDFAHKLHLPLEHLAYSSRSIQKINERSFLKRTGAEYDKLFRSSKYLREEFTTNKQDFRKVLNQAGNVRTEPGLYKGVHLAFLRYGHALKDILINTTPDANIVFAERPVSKEDSFLLSKYGNALAEWLTADYTRVNKLQQGLDQKKRMIGKDNPDVDAIIAQYKKLLGTHSKTVSNNLFYGSLTQEELQKVIAAQPFALTTTAPLPAEDVLYVLNTTSKLERAKYKFSQQFETTYEDVKEQLEHMVATAKNLVTENGLDVIHQEGPYFYLHGDPTTFLKKYEDNHPLIHTFDNALITRDTTLTPTGNFSTGRQRLFYNLFGYYKGFKVVDHPAHYLNMNEMRQFDGFFKHLVKGEHEQALEAIIRGYTNVTEKKLSPEELVFYSKASERYTILEEGEKRFFRTKLPSGVTYHPFKGFLGKEGAPELFMHEEKGTPYLKEHIGGKEQPVYIKQLGETSPDWDAYTEKQHARIRNLLSSLISPSLTEELLTGKTNLLLWKREAAQRLAERTFS